MTPIRFLAPSLLAVLLASCGTQKANSYDTPTTPDSSSVNAPAAAQSNPVYDTPAAYEESTGTTAPAADIPNIPAPATNRPATTAAPTRPSATAAAPKPSVNGAAIIHTVVAGDTLSGISAKYKVPVAAIKQANNMTKDTVVLGKKMVIPPVH